MIIVLPVKNMGGKQSTQIWGENREGKVRKVRYWGEEKEENGWICNITACL